MTSSLRSPLSGDAAPTRANVIIGHTSCLRWGWLLFLAVSFVGNPATAQFSRSNTKSSNVYRANYQRVVVGDSSTFELRNGTLWAWGYNGY